MVHIKKKLNRKITHKYTKNVAKINISQLLQSFCATILSLFYKNRITRIQNHFGNNISHKNVLFSYLQ